MTIAIGRPQLFGRRELEALAVAVGRFREPFPGRARIAVHELRQARPRGSVPHACELALAGILILGGRQSLLPVQVAFLLPTHVLLPGRHRQSL